MRTIILKKFSLTAVLSLAALSAYAAEQAPSAPVQATAATSTTTTATADKPGLTRAQVLEDLKRYQHEHANPSYAELVFLR
ncbi:hypothetical protein [Herbaspirillum sp. NPDC087042]|uniref:hypothetical protein n=1 Tax=Herbaspirillum sp. NPDC087042 TaxID=3364004 RepID=UPI00381BD77D